MSRYSQTKQIKKRVIRITKSVNREPSFINIRVLAIPEYMGCRNRRVVPLHAISEAVAITTDFKWTMYTVFLPLPEGQFRAVLQGNEKNEMDICLESADNVVETRNGVFLVYIHAGTDPFEVIYPTSG